MESTAAPFYDRLRTQRAGEWRWGVGGEPSVFMAKSRGSGENDTVEEL